MDKNLLIGRYCYLFFLTYTTITLNYFVDFISQMHMHAAEIFE